MKTIHQTKPTHVMTELKNDPIKTQSKDGVATLIGGRHGMNAMKQVLLGLVLAGAVMVPHHGAAWETDTLNVQFNTDMMSTGVDPNASGTILGTLVRSGRSSNQQLKLSLAHLDPNTAYQLIAFMGDETNPRLVAEFTTDRNGAFAVTYAQNCPRISGPGGHPGDGDDSGDDHGNGKGNGKGKGNWQRQGQARQGQAPSSRSTDSTAPECDRPNQPHP